MTIDTEGRTSEASPSALCYERPRPHCRRNASANQEEGNKTTVKKMKTTRKQRGSAMRSRRRQPRMRGRQWRDPSPTTGYARRLGDDWRDTAGGTERRTLFFSCNFRWPYAQRRGRHDDAASNDERKQKQFRTGEWRTNKKEAYSWGARLSIDIYTILISKIYDQDLGGVIVCQSWGSSQSCMTT